MDISSLNNYFELYGGMAMVLKLEIQYSLHFMMETRKFLLRVLSWQVPTAVMIPF